MEAQKLILQKGKKLTQRSFVKAAQASNIDLVQLYIQAGFDVNKPDQHDTTPLEAAVMSGSLNKVKLLIDNGASVKDPGLFFSAVYDAAFTDNTDILDLLAISGAPINAVDEETGFNAYELVKDMGNISIAEHLKSKYGF